MRDALLIAATALAVLPAPAARAERALGLDEALDLARTKNRDLAAARATLEGSDATVEQAWAALLPVIGAQGRYTHNYKEVALNFGQLTAGPFAQLLDIVGPANLATLVPPENQPRLAAFQSGLQAALNAEPAVIVKGEQLDGVLQATVPLINVPGWKNLSAAKTAREAAGANYDATLAAVLVRVAQAYYGAAGADELQKVRQHAIDVAKETLENAKARFATGVVNRVEVMRAELALVRAEQQAVDTKELRDQAYRALATVLDLREDFRVAPPAEAAQAPALPGDARDQALGRRPELHALGLQLEAVDQQIDAALWRWAPTLSAFANARVQNYKGFSGDDYAWAIGAQLDWAIYDAGLRDAQRHQATAQKSELELRLAALRDNVSDEIANALGAVETRRRGLDTAKRSVELSTETLALVRAQHDAGTATQIDLLQAQDNLIATEVQLAQSRFDLALAGIALDRALGTFPAKK